MYEPGINGLMITDPRRVIDNLMNRWYEIKSDKGYGVPRGKREFH